MKFLGFVLALCLILTGCGKNETRESYGLRVIEINLPEDRKNDFLADFRGDIQYEAEILIDGQENQGTVQPAGSTSISLYKKSLDCEILVGSRDWKGQSFRLSAQKTDLSLLKSFIGFEYYRRIGLLVPDLEPVVVYLNGELWGLYVKIENINESFFEARGLDVDLLYKADNGALFDEATAQNPNYVFDAKIGKKNFEIIKEISYLVQNPDRPQSQQILSELIDSDSFGKLLRGIVLMGHWDSVGNNFQMYRVKGEKKLRALAWDLDAIWEPETHPFNSGFAGSSYNNLFRYLLERSQNDHFTNMRNDLTTHMSAATLDAIANPYIESMRSAYADDPVLGGTGLTIDSEYAKLRTIILNWWNDVDQELTSRGY